MPTQIWICRHFETWYSLKYKHSKQKFHKEMENLASKKCRYIQDMIVNIVTHYAFIPLKCV